jgi:hypothetical protein
VGRKLSHDEIIELLGAYALDAVDGDERDAVIAHLQVCLLCLTEVAEHREVAAFIGPPTMAAPAHPWEQIAGALVEAPPPLELANVRRIDSGRRWGGRVGTVAAAAVACAAVALIAVLGVKVSDDSRRIDNLAGGTYGAQLSRATKAALTDSNARLVDLRAPAGAGNASAQVVVLPDGTGYVVKNNLPALDPGSTYQLWAVVGDAKISVGVLGPQPGPSGFKAAGDISALAITQERAGGVVASDQSPVVVGSLA